MTDTSPPALTDLDLSDWLSFVMNSRGWTIGFWLLMLLVPGAFLLLPLWLLARRQAVPSSGLEVEAESLEAESNGSQGVKRLSS